ncbi:MAG TPA: arabinan endo-1,5-alpha-L-arabinosidase, partial [Tepidisphaeraceae bacterium]|nr:arabinan endo-1,5-alpha-L-arabinosidase [Tepidisphaeraceae bacterium]
MCGVGGCRFGAWLVVLLGLAGSIPAATHDPDDQDCAAFAGDGWVSASGRHVHDPTLFEASAGSYLCFSTSGDGFGVVRSSQNLIDWTVHGAITETPQWLRQRIPEHRSMWAPDLLRLPDGRLRLYYCASQRFGQNTSWIGLAENDAFDPSRPQQGWRDLGPVIHSQRDRDDFNAIDPDAVIDAASGQHWLFFGSFWSGLYALELDPDTGKPLNPDKPQMIPVARNSERGNPIEAPVVAFRDGYYYLFVSYGLAAQGVRSTYRIVVGRSRQITGPYLGRDGRPMLEGGHAVVLKSSAPMFAPGHCDVMR